MDRGLPLSRRTLLASAGAGALTLAGGGAILRAAAPAAAPMPLGRSAFVPLVGEVFELRATGGDRLQARLSRVDDLRGAPRGAENAFSLTLHASRRARLRQDVLDLHHTRLGTASLLVTPSGTGAQGQDYAIVINRSSSGQL